MLGVVASNAAGASAPTADTSTEDERTDWVGLISIILLSVTAILTAWAGFQASKWGGAMSISFAQASSARLESAALAAEADRTRSFQIGVFAQYLQSVEAGNDAVEQ